MKSATIAQFHELISKLLTKTNYKDIDFNTLQELIRDPEKLVLSFIDFLNCSDQQFLGLCIVDSSRKIIRPTSLRSGDRLIFYTKDRTMKIYRESLDNGKRIYFNRMGNLDDKTINNLTDKEEILCYCSFLAQFVNNCNGVKLLYETGTTPDLVHVQLC